MLTSNRKGIWRKRYLKKNLQILESSKENLEFRFLESLDYKEKSKEKGSIFCSVYSKDSIRFGADKF